MALFPAEPSADNTESKTADTPHIPAYCPPATAYDLREALRLWDWQKQPEDQPTEALNFVELRLVNRKDIPRNGWLDARGPDRCSTISKSLVYALKRALWDCGCGMVSFKLKNGDGKLEILVSPKCGGPDLNLPSLLAKYIKIEDKRDWFIFG